jgi:hypothetical protein
MPDVPCRQRRYCQAIASLSGRDQEGCAMRMRDVQPLSFNLLREVSVLLVWPSIFDDLHPAASRPFV